MPSDRDYPTGWIDYVIASDDPADKALVREYAISGWEIGQVIHWLLSQLKKGAVTEEMLAELESIHERTEQVRDRVCKRGQALFAAGAAPADELPSRKWRERFEELSSLVHRDSDPPLPL
jgi:hypothetical protein